jgi:hypothetical protein
MTRRRTMEEYEQQQEESVERAPTLGNCYESTTCTPAGNPMPGGGGTTQEECRVLGGKSWRAVNNRGIEVGPCISPP